MPNPLTQTGLSGQTTQALQDQGRQDKAPASESDFDATQDRAMLSAIEAELEESRASIDSQFIDKFSEEIEINEDLQNLYFEDKKAFFTQYEEKKQAFLDEWVAPKIKRREELIGIIKDKEHGGKVFKIKKEFQDAHPEVSLQELDDFYTNELSKRVQEEISKMPAMQGYEKILELYKKEKGAESTAQPPKKFDSVFMSDKSKLTDVRSSDLPMNRY